jgi:excisionase family DNA binding protein
MPMTPETHAPVVSSDENCWGVFSFCERKKRDMEPLMTPQELASLLKISVSAVRELCRQRTRLRSTIPLPAIRIHKKAIRFERAAVEKWLRDIAESQNPKGNRK